MRRARDVALTAPISREETMRKVFIAALIAALPTAGALAQNAPSPENQSGPGVSPTTPSPTDPSSAAESGNTRGIPERGTITTTPPATTGSGVLLSPQPMDR